MREFMAPGVYWITAKAVNEDVLLNFDQRNSFCETYNMIITVHPTASASLMFHSDVEEMFCEEMDPMVNTLRVEGMVRANLTKELSSYGAEVGYFDFDGND